jgi:hypothetical protein
LLFHAKVVALVADQFVGFLEAGFVEKQVYAFARGKFSFGVLARAALFSTARFGSGVAAREFFSSV